MKDSPPVVKCSHCSGRGTVELSPTLLKVFRAVQSAKVVTAPGLFKLLIAMGWPLKNIPAVNNRLEDLRRYGLLRRSRAGKVWEYTVNRK